MCPYCDGPLVPGSLSLQGYRCAAGCQARKRVMCPSCKTPSLMNVIGEGDAREWECTGGCQKRSLPNDPVSVDELDALFHLTHVDNVASILAEGIFSHSAMKDRGYKRIDDVDVQAQRRGAKIPGGRSVHEYVPLFFNGRPPMLFVCRKKHGESAICRVEIFKSILSTPGALICDRNVAATTQEPQWAGAPAGLALLSRDAVVERWDPRSEDQRHKQLAQAELLIPNHVKASQIRSVVVKGRSIPSSLKGEEKVEARA